MCRVKQRLCRIGNSAHTLDPCSKRRERHVPWNEMRIRATWLFLVPFSPLCFYTRSVRSARCTQLPSASFSFLHVCFWFLSNAHNSRILHKALSTFAKPCIVEHSNVSVAEMYVMQDASGANLAIFQGHASVFKIICRHLGWYADGRHEAWGSFLTEL